MSEFTLSMLHRSIAVRNSHHRYGNSHAIWDHSVTCHPAEVRGDITVLDDDDDDDDDGRINFNVAYSPKTARTRNS